MRWFVGYMQCLLELTQFQEQDEDIYLWQSRGLDFPCVIPAQAGIQWSMQVAFPTNGGHCVGLIEAFCVCLGGLVVQ